MVYGLENVSIDSGSRFKPQLVALRNGLVSIQENIVILERASNELEKLGVLSDFNNIVFSFKNLILLLQKASNMDSSKEGSEKEWREIRHDMRASIGTIKGYAELIIEDLEDAETPLSNLFQSLDDIAIQQLPIIEKLELEHHDVEYHDKGAVKKGSLKEEDIISPFTVKERTDALKPVRKPGRILIVDDDDHKRDILTRRLKKYGHQTIPAQDGYRALEIVQHTDVDLILLDMLMPGMTGYDVLVKLKEDPSTSSIPVLIISSLNDVENVVNCIQIGADDYLPMPFNPTLLMARIHACLDKKFLREKDEEQQRQLDHARLQLQAAIESIAEGFAVFDENDQMVMYNKKFTEMYPVVQNFSDRFSYTEFLTENYNSGLYLIEDRRNASKQVSFDNWFQYQMNRHLKGNASHVIQLTDGRWFEVRETHMPDGGTVTVHKDVTSAKKDEQRLEYLANHDPLTGLANRSLFERALKENVALSEKNKGAFAVMFLDLDGFKNVNDSMGHDFGDQVLIEAAQQIKSCVRDEDIVARLGGDEFSVILTNMTDRKIVTSLADRMLKAVKKKIEKGDKLAQIGVSIGISFYPEDGINSDELLSRADTAMYAAKQAGRGVYKLASSS